MVKDKMVVKVMFQEEGDKCVLFESGDYIYKQARVRLVGIYRVSKRTNGYWDPKRTVLTRIRDAGGECIEGEPLPEKCKDTWPLLRRPHFVYSAACPLACGRCSVAVESADKVHCPSCGCKLSGEVTWDENRYRQHEC
jgi:hypothetical protein